MQNRNTINLVTYFQNYFEKFKKTDLYLVAVSTGPDSTFLLHFLLKNNFSNLIVCFVNYNIRKNAKKEELYLTKFCKEKNLILKILSYKLKIMTNFQENARNIRYYYFFQLLKSYQAKGIFLAHQKNDLYENILMKTKNDDYFLLNEIKNFYQFKIIRPLLEITKKKIISYLKLNKIYFFIDRSNFSLKYKRNKVRKEVKNLEKLNFDKKQLNWSEITKKTITLKELKKINKDQSFFLLKQFIYQNSKVYFWKKISLNKCKNFIKQIINNETKTFYFLIEKNHYLIYKNKNIFLINWFFRNN